MEEDEREINIEVENEETETVENPCVEVIGSLDFESQSEVNQETATDDTESSNLGFYDNLTFENPLDEKSETKETIEPVNQDMFMADLAEENANSVPSTLDENLPMIDEEIQHGENNLNKDYEMKDDELSLDTKTEDTLAQSEDLQQKDEQATDLDAENISEDELPIPTKLKVQDAEEVSDEELPGPKMAELPADTEVVSEEELPSSNAPNNVKKDGKRKLEDYDPCDPTADENESPEKKTKKEDEEKKYKLPDLEKYWKSVHADAEDFNAWTYLLQYVDSGDDLEASREAYDKFLSRYPYCYGYWRKYADYEKKKGSLEKCEEVFERGLKAIPLSVDLWIHYLTYAKQKYQDDRDAIRNQFERALNFCGLEFRSDKLWEGYIRWELEGKDLLKVIDIYDRLLATPTQGYKTHMDNFRELVNNNPVQKLLTVEEFKKCREDVRKGSNEKGDDEAPPGLDEADDHVRNEEEADNIRKLIINKRKKINKLNVEMINKRWSFEEGIKRPYFHVKQLEKIQLKNWNEYLDYEIEQKDNKKRTLVLFERCLIACALYEEFWIKLIHYLEQNKDDTEFEERIRDVFERACCIHHREKPSLHLMWSAFEESCGNIDKASTILENLEKKNPSLLQVAYRRINLERRRGNIEVCTKLYERYLSNTKNKNISSSLAIKFARFLNKVKHEFDRAMDVLKNALEKDTTNTRLALQIVDLALQRDNVNEKEVLEVLDRFMQQDNLDIDQKLLFAQRKVEFLEDFGSCIKQLQESQKALQSLMEKHSKDNKKKSSDHELSKKTKESSSSVNNPSYNSSINYQSYSNSSYPQSNQWSGNYNYDYNQWSGSYYNSSSYGNYQHGSYGNSY
ncbi:pre-mRNA-processing factor 39 isoform X2 [Chironomus tepperi]